MTKPAENVCAQTSTEEKKMREIETHTATFEFLSEAADYARRKGKTGWWLVEIMPVSLAAKPLNPVNHMSIYHAGHRLISPSLYGYFVLLQRQKK